MIRILLVDDDTTNSMLLKRFLEAEEFEVVYAADGAVGWELFGSYKPELVLLDVNMPELNGFELAGKIREVDSEVTLFFLSDRTEKNDRLKGFSLRGNDYIPKPFYPEELVAKIRERFSVRSATQNAVYQIGGVTTFAPALCQIEIGGTIQTLSARQTKILELLAMEQGKIVERGEILQKIWGNDSYANSLALNVQITYLRNALKPDPSVSITSLKGRGYLLKTT